MTDNENGEFRRLVSNVDESTVGSELEEYEGYDTKQNGVTWTKGIAVLFSACGALISILEFDKTGSIAWSGGCFSCNIGAFVALSAAAGVAIYQVVLKQLFSRIIGKSMYILGYIWCCIGVCHFFVILPCLVMLSAFGTTFHIYIYIVSLYTVYYPYTLFIRYL